MTRMACFALAVAVYMCVLASQVLAHGSLRRPTGRQFCHPDGVNGVQEEAGNGARGRANAYGDQNGGMPSFCGDPFEGSGGDRGDPDYINHACPSQETYQQGGIVTLEVAIKFNHGGSWEVAVCCDDVVTQECLDENKLTDAEFGEHMWYIQEEGPIDPNDDDFQIYMQDWILPADVYGDKCLLVWTWWTAHRCVMWPCPERSCGAYSARKSPVDKPEMLEPGSTWEMPVCERYPEPGEYPQIFRNCADITIEKGPGGNDSDEMAPEDLEPMSPAATEAPEQDPQQPEEVETESEEEAPEQDPEQPEEVENESDEEDPMQEPASRQSDPVPVEPTFAEEEEEEENTPSLLYTWLNHFTG